MFLPKANNYCMQNHAISAPGESSICCTKAQHCHLLNVKQSLSVATVICIVTNTTYCHFCYFNIQGDTTFISSASDETQKVETRQAVQRIYCSNHQKCCYGVLGAIYLVILATLPLLYVFV